MFNEIKQIIVNSAFSFVLCVLFLFKGLKAIHSPLTGIIDYGLVARTYGEELKKLGGSILTEYEVTNFSENSG